MKNDMHGVPLIERVIDAVTRDGLGGFCGEPRLTKPRPLSPEAIECLRLPGDKPLSPSMRRWLAFDASWLTEVGWFIDRSTSALDARSLSQNADRMYGFGRSEHAWTEMFAEFERLLPGEGCLPLVGGSDSRRLLYIGEPDSLGEYPVLVTDIDDMPYVAVMYPGLDVYLAHEAGVVDLDFATYTGLVEHDEYGHRMRQHAAQTGLGLEGMEIQDLFMAEEEGEA